MELILQIRFNKKGEGPTDSGAGEEGFTEKEGVTGGGQGRGRGVAGGGAGFLLNCWVYIKMAI